MHCIKHHCAALHCTFTVQDVVIAVAVESGKDTLDMAAVAPTLEDVKELKTIEKKANPARIWPWPTPLLTVNLAGTFPPNLILENCWNPPTKKYLIPSKNKIILDVSKKKKK